MHIVKGKLDMRGDWYEIRQSTPGRRQRARADWFCDLSGKTARITSIGNRSLLVENHCGILEFTEERITLATRCGSVVVTGGGLSLSQVRRDALVIDGSIRDVQLPHSEADHES